MIKISDNCGGLGNQLFRYSIGRYLSECWETNLLWQRGGPIPDGQRSLGGRHRPGADHLRGKERPVAYYSFDAQAYTDHR